MKIKKLPAAIRARINDFDAAAQEYAFKGSADPDSWGYIIEDYKDARKNLEATILRALSRASG